MYRLLSDKRICNVRRQNEPPQVRGLAQSPHHTGASQDPSSEGNGRKQASVGKLQGLEGDARLDPSHTETYVSDSSPCTINDQGKDSPQSFWVQEQKREAGVRGLGNGLRKGRESGNTLSPSSFGGTLRRPHNTCHGESRRFQHKRLEMLASLGGSWLSAQHLGFSSGGELMGRGNTPR